MKLIVGQAEKGRIKVEDALQIPLPEAGMINGIVTDTTIMADFFDQMVKEYGISSGEILQNRLLKNDTLLVVHNNSVQTKILEVPAVRDAQVREFIAREFAKNDNEEEAAKDVNDYTVLRPKGPQGGVEILATSVHRDLLEDYRTSLVSANLKLKGINIGVNSLIKLVSIMPELGGQTFLLMNIDYGEQNIALFLDGSFRLSNRYRLLNPTGTSEWFGELGKNLNAMLQFQRAQRGLSELKVVYTAGLTPQQSNIFSQYSSQLNVAIEPFNMSKTIVVSKRVAERGGFDPGAYLLALGNLVRR
jgi:Tfp pilus assembly PilM family ATPase